MKAVSDYGAAVMRAHSLNLIVSPFDTIDRNIDAGERLAYPGVTQVFHRLCSDKDAKALLHALSELTILEGGLTFAIRARAINDGLRAIAVSKDDADAVVHNVFLDVLDDASVPLTGLVGGKDLLRRLDVSSKGRTPLSGDAGREALARHPSSGQCTGLRRA